MKRYIYYCPKCGFLGSAVHENEEELQLCSECSTSMYNTKIEKEMWDGYTKEEKHALKIKFDEAIKKSHFYRTGIDFERMMNELEIQTHHLEVIMYVGLVVIALLILILCKMIA
nr:hypothetical protein [uncultured Cellulosilyticum sp.]